VWEVVAELVSITARPRPVNPFQIHLAYVENLPAVHATLCKLAWHAPRAGDSSMWRRGLACAACRRLEYVEEGNTLRALR